MNLILCLLLVIVLLGYSVASNDDDNESKAALLKKKKAIVAKKRLRGAAAAGAKDVGVIGVAAATRQKTATSDTTGGLQRYNRFKSYANSPVKPPQYAADSEVKKKIPISEYLSASQERLQTFRQGRDREEAMVRKDWTANTGAAKGTKKAGRVRKGLRGTKAASANAE